MAKHVFSTFRVLRISAAGLDEDVALIVVHIRRMLTENIIFKASVILVQQYFKKIVSFDVGMHNQLLVSCFLFIPYVSQRDLLLPTLSMIVNAWKTGRDFALSTLRAPQIGSILAVPNVIDIVVILHNLSVCNYQN